MKFDMIIGNPPYNEGSESIHKTSKARGCSNFCLLFLEKSMQWLDDNGLICRATTPHIYMRDYVKGSFTNPDSKLRSTTKDRLR